MESPINKGMTKRQFENLQKFFALAIESPMVRKISLHLIKWPNNDLVVYKIFRLLGTTY